MGNDLKCLQQIHWIIPSYPHATPEYINKSIWNEILYLEARDISSQIQVNCLCYPGRHVAPYETLKILTNLCPRKNHDQLSSAYLYIIFEDALLLQEWALNKNNENTKISNMKLGTTIVKTGSTLIYSLPRGKSLSASFPVVEPKPRMETKDDANSMTNNANKDKKMILGYDYYATVFEGEPVFEGPKNPYRLRIISKNFVETFDNPRVLKFNREKFNINLFIHNMLLYKLKITTNVPIFLELLLHEGCKANKNSPCQCKTCDGDTNLYQRQIGISSMTFGDSTQGEPFKPISSKIIILTFMSNESVDPTKNKLHEELGRFEEHNKSTIVENKKNKSKQNIKSKSQSSVTSSKIKTKHTTDISELNSKSKTPNYDTNLWEKYKKRNKKLGLGNVSTIALMMSEIETIYPLNDEGFKLTLPLSNELSTKSDVLNKDSIVEIKIFSPNNNPQKILLSSNFSTNLKFDLKQSLVFSGDSVDVLLVEDEDHPLVIQTYSGLFSDNDLTSHKFESYRKFSSLVSSSKDDVMTSTPNLETSPYTIPFLEKARLFVFKDSTNDGALFKKQPSNLIIHNPNFNRYSSSVTSFDTFETPACIGSYAINETTGEISCLSARSKGNPRVFSVASFTKFYTPKCVGSLIYDETTGKFSCSTLRTHATEGTLQGFPSGFSAISIPFSRLDTRDRDDIPL